MIIHIDNKSTNTSTIIIPAERLSAGHYTINVSIESLFVSGCGQCHVIPLSRNGKKASLRENSESNVSTPSAFTIMLRSVRVCVEGGMNELGTKWIAVSGVVCGVNYHNFL